MTAKELRLKDEGIQVTCFEAPRRMDAEIARQQCGLCGEECHAECEAGECDTYCVDDCWNQCVGEETLQVRYMATPRSVSLLTAQTRTGSIVHSAVY